MRILVVNWRDIRNPEAGGAEVHLQEIFSRIAGAGHHVTFLCSLFPDAPSHEWIDGIEVVRFGQKHTFNLTVPWVYHKHLASRKFDVIIEALNKIPFFLPRMIDRPTLVIVHHLFGRPVFRETNPIFASYIYFSERLIPVFYRTCLFEAISDSTKAELTDMGLPEDRIEVVYSGHNRTQYNGEDALHEKTAPLIIYVGRIKRYKNIDHLIQAMPLIQEAVPDARLAVVGDGDYRPALETLCLKLGVRDAVEFTGYISEEEKVAWLRRSMVSAFPSSKEGWGLTVIEANACYTPVVATNVPGLRDAVVDGETGVLVEPGDIRTLADKLIWLLRDREARERMAIHAANWAARFTWEATATQTLQLIERVVREHP